VTVVELTTIALKICVLLLVSEVVISMKPDLESQDSLVTLIELQFPYEEALRLLNWTMMALMMYVTK